MTNVVTSEGDNAYTRAGGWRGEQPGIGIAQTSTAMLAPVDGARRLEIDRTRVDKYNRVGILIDGAQNDFAPFMASGTINWGVITASQVIGRTLCVNYAGTGSCNTPGLVTTGPLFGQDGLRVTAGSYATVDSTLLSQNLVKGTGAPVRGADTNNANLNLGRGRALRRRQADELLDRHRRGHPLVPDALEHRRQRLRRAQPGRRRHDDQHRQPERGRVRQQRQPAQGREQLVGRAQPRHPARHSAAADLADDQPAGAGEPGQRHGHGRDGHGRRRPRTRSTSSRTAAARSRTRSPARGRS